MNFDLPPVPQKKPETLNQKDIFQKALEEELTKMENSGRLSPEQSEEKRRAAALIENGFSDDPEHDALIFCRAGIADEKEMVDVLNNKSENHSLIPEDEASLEEDRDFKDIFLRALDQELISAVNNGKISQEKAEEKRKTASLIEVGFSENPKRDALIFSRAGIADEKEMAELLKEK